MKIKLPRVSIAGMMSAIVLIAVSIAAFRFPTPLAANGFYTFALVVLASSLCGVVFCRSRRRAYWAGFAFFGWGYFLLIFGPWPEGMNPEHRLFTTAVLDLTHSFRAEECQCWLQLVRFPHLCLCFPPHPLRPFLPSRRSWNRKNE